MSFKATYTILFFILFFSFCHAQYEVKGLVQSAKNIPIDNASIVIFDQNKNIIAYTYSKTNGKFRLSFDDKNTYVLLSAQRLGYAKKTDTIYTNTLKKTYTTTLLLLEKKEPLQEVVLKSDAKIKREGNKIIYKVAAFKNGTEQTVEDILKKIPGVEVLKDGRIKAHGRYIDKLLIEGDDMFDKNYTMLSKNLDSKVLRSIEILEEFEDNPVLAKVLSSNKVAINLRLKEEYKNIWFGNVTIGKGTKDRIKLASNLGLIKKKIKFFNFNSYDNLGNFASNQITTNSNSTIENFNTPQKELTIKPSYNVPLGKTTSLKDSEASFNEAFINSLSFVKSLNSKIKLRGTGYLANDLNSESSIVNTIFTTSNPLIVYNEKLSFNSNNTVFGGDLELRYINGEKSYIKNTIRYKNSPKKTNQQILFNSKAINEFQNLNESSFLNHFNYSILLKKKRLLHNYVYIGNNVLEQKVRLESTILNTFLSQAQDAVVYNNSKDNRTILGSRSSMLFHLGKIKNLVTMGYEILKEKKNNDFIINEGITATTIDTLQNQLNYNQQKIELKTSYKYTLSSKIDVFSELLSNYVSVKTGELSKSELIFSPKIRIGVKNLKIGIFSFQYAKDYSVPKANLFLNNYQISSFQSFNKGTKNIYFIKRDKYRFSYGISNNLHTQSVAIRVQFIDEKGRYSSINEINQNFSFSRSQFIDGGDMLITKIDFTSYFKKLKISTNIGILQNRTNTKIAINSSGIKKISLLASSYTLSGRTYFKLPVNLNFTLNLLKNTSTFNKIKSKTNWKSINLEINGKLSDVLAISLQNKFYDLKNGNYNFMHFKLDYTPKKAKLSYQLKFNNITKEELFIVENISDYSIYKSTIQLLPRYVLFSAKYRF